MTCRFNQHIDYILSNKKLFFGIAILLVIFSHLIHVDFQCKVWYVFYPGFIGVDIFMFFSGYGLCKSFESNSLPRFYYHRFKRVYPIYLLFAIISCLLFIWEQGVHVPLREWILASTTLSFWGLGQVFVDWYLSFLILLYLIFPVLYFVEKKISHIGVYIALLTIFPILIWCNLPWTLSCSLPRIPIFLMGIACALYPNKPTYKISCIAFAFAFLSSAVLLCLGYIPKYIVVYMFAPFFMLLLAYIFSKMSSQSSWYKWLCFLGSISLELYVANMILLRILEEITVPYGIAIIYFALQAIITLCLVYINKGIQHLFNAIEQSKL